MARIPLATFSDRVKAERVRKRLVESGIDAEISDEPLAKLWFVSKEETSVRIKVAADQFERPNSSCSSGTLPREYCARRFAVRSVSRCGSNIRHSLEDLSFQIW
jgi:hypothetical protein